MTAAMSQISDKLPSFGLHKPVFGSVVPCRYEYQVGNPKKPPPRQRSPTAAKFVMKVAKLSIVLVQESCWNYIVQKRIPEDEQQESKKAAANPGDGLRSILRIALRTGILNTAEDNGTDNHQTYAAKQ